LVLGTPTTIAQWTFETSQPATAGPFAPEVGSGNASGSHAGAAVYSSPTGNGSTHSYSSTVWNVNDYWQFSTSTLGYQNITLSWDQTSSNTGPGVFGLFWSTDGSTFAQFGLNYNVPAPTTTWGSYSYDLSSIASLNNASTVYLRLVDESTANAAGTGAVGTSGTDRVDNFTVSGIQIPANVPDSAPGLAGLGCALGLLAVLRRISNVSCPLSQKHA
jgi:hypothetical protein